MFRAPEISIVVLKEGLRFIGKLKEARLERGPSFYLYGYEMEECFKIKESLDIRRASKFGLFLVDEKDLEEWPHIFFTHDKLALNVKCNQEVWEKIFKEKFGER